MNEPKKFDPLTSDVSNWTATEGAKPYSAPTWIDLWVAMWHKPGPAPVLCASRQGDAQDWDFETSQ